MEVRKEAPSDAALESIAGRASRSTTLAELAPGEGGCIVAVGGDPVVSDRLRELGLCPGTTITFERRAPLGDPFVFRFRGTRLALRRTEASLIRVGGVHRQGARA